MNKYNAKQLAVNQIRSIFEVRVEAGRTVGECFEYAREKVAVKLAKEAEIAGMISFQDFARDYIPAGVTAETVWQA